MKPVTKRRLVGRFLTVLTFVLVGINLLPILWMVYCSIQGNNEILLGKVALGRRDSPVNLLTRTKDGVLAGTQDGGLALFQDHGNEMEVVRGGNYGWFATSYAVKNDKLWALTADQGFLQFDGQLKITHRWDVGDLQDAWESQFPKQKWQTLWVNDVYSSSVVAKEGRILGIYRKENTPGLMALDPATGSIRFHTPSTDLPIKVDEVVDVGGADSVLLVGSTGMLLWDVKAAKSVTQWNWGSGGLPWDRPRLVRGTSRDQVFLAWDRQVQVLSLSQAKVVKVLDDRDSLGLDGIRALANGSDRLWLGSTRGMLGLDTAAGHSTDSTTDAQEVRPNRHDAVVFDGLGAIPSGIVSMTDFGNQLLVGGAQGELAVISVSQVGFRLGSSGQVPVGSLYIHWRNYIDLWRNIPFGTYLSNSLSVCLMVMLISMTLASMAGYALARFKFLGRDLFGYTILTTQMVPGIMFLIPIYILFTKVNEVTGIKIVGSYWGLVVLYSAFYVPFTIWILRGFFAAIPKELEEAALVDGCTPFRAFWSVILPAARPGIVATGIYVFLTVWDELMFAWVLTDEKTYTIPVGIRLFAGNYQNRYDLMMAAATVATVPVMALFFLMQKQIVSGLTAGAVKG
jgi:multiple sugar transport system permease protein